MTCNTAASFCHHQSPFSGRSKGTRGGYDNILEKKIVEKSIENDNKSLEMKSLEHLSKILSKIDKK